MKLVDIVFFLSGQSFPILVKKIDIRWDNLGTMMFFFKKIFDDHSFSWDILMDISQGYTA
jgi:hypothetical protein